MFKIIKKIFLSLCAAAMTLVGLWAAGLIWYGALIITAKPQSMESRTDALIVLTGGQNRIVEGVRLLDDRKSRKLFISGVHKDVKLTSLTGINPPCCITLGYEAQNTRENAIESKDWIAKEDVKTIRLITSDYHMPRAALEFKHHIPDLERLLKHPVKGQRHVVFSRSFFELVFEEYHKYLATWIRLHVTPPQTEAEE